MPNPQYEYIVEQDRLGLRLDVFISQQIDGLSRSRAIELVRAGHVLINGKQPKASVRLRTGDRVLVDAVDLKPELPIAEVIPLDILYEDDVMVAVNKPAGMVVHPAKGHWQGTLTAGLMHHIQSLSKAAGPQRPGIVHRLDRDTSGVILVAKTDPVHLALSQQFQNRTVVKQYLAIVTPPPNHDRDEINQPIGPHPYQREKMAIRDRHPNSREAITFFEVKSRCGRMAIVHAFPKTGRTHQIRVHLAHWGSPVLCDKLYSGRNRITQIELLQQLGRNESVETLSDQEFVLQRQALHAQQISFQHPISGQSMELSAPIPEDIQHVIELIETERG